MTSMKEDIKYVLSKHPGLRKREIAGYLHVWQCDLAFLDAMHELDRDNEIYSEYHHDIGNMEFYDKWYIMKEAI